MMIRRVLKALALPPLSLFVLAVAGWIVSRRFRKTGRAMIALAVLAFLVLSLPWVGSRLLTSLETDPPLPADFGGAGAGAIVVLSAEVERPGGEYGGPTVGPLTLQRMRYGVLLARRTGLPLLVSGGIVVRDTRPVADMMRDVLRAEFGIEPRWVENRSATTRGNAIRSAKLLRADEIASVVLVTHAWHMPRARAEFEAVGLQVVPAPTGFHREPDLDLSSFVPSMKALNRSYWGLHERLGLAWYALTRP